MSDLAAVLVDGRHRYEIHYNTDAWVASIEWAKFHGLDPMSIPQGAVVERDGPGRCIRYESFVKTGPGFGDIEVNGYEPIIVNRIERGEGILPLPKEVTRGSTI